MEHRRQGRACDFKGPRRRRRCRAPFDFHHPPSAILDIGSLVSRSQIQPTTLLLGFTGRRSNLKDPRNRRASSNRWSKAHPSRLSPLLLSPASHPSPTLRRISLDVYREGSYLVPVQDAPCVSSLLALSLQPSKAEQSSSPFSLSCSFSRRHRQPAQTSKAQSPRCRERRFWIRQGWEARSDALRTLIARGAAPILDGSEGELVLCLSLSLFSFVSSFGSLFSFSII